MPLSAKDAGCSVVKGRCNTIMSPPGKGSQMQQKRGQTRNSIKQRGRVSPSLKLNPAPARWHHQDGAGFFIENLIATRSKIQNNSGLDGFFDNKKNISSLGVTDQFFVSGITAFTRSAFEFALKFLVF